jgi:hypothetical protein
MHGGRTGHTQYGAHCAQRMETKKTNLSMLRPEAFGKAAWPIRNADEACQPKEIFSNPSVTMDINRQRCDARIRQHGMCKRDLSAAAHKLVPRRQRIPLSRSGRA